MHGACDISPTAHQPATAPSRSGACYRHGLIRLRLLCRTAGLGTVCGRATVYLARPRGLTGHRCARPVSSEVRKCDRRGREAAERKTSASRRSHMRTRLMVMRIGLWVGLYGRRDDGRADERQRATRRERGTARAAPGLSLRDARWVNNKRSPASFLPNCFLVRCVSCDLWSLVWYIEQHKKMYTFA